MYVLDADGVQKRPELAYPRHIASVASPAFVLGAV